MLSQDQIDRLRLLRTARIGPVSYFQLLARFGSASAAIDALPDLAARNGARVRICPESVIHDEAARLAKAGGHYLFHDDPAYPGLLLTLDNAPPVFTYAGELALMQHPALAMVGARNSSAAARKMARALAHDLADAGVVCVSGLARGIDTAAHEGAMAAGKIAGMHATIGVIASGIDISYPPENEALQHQMGESALVIAEQPPGTEPLARHFPYRNRIIAGLAGATLVVEAAPKSGSLITARLAAEAGRDVLAIPGSPLDARSRGCNELIRGGAILVQGVDDILEAMRDMGGMLRAPPARAAAPIVAEAVAEPAGDERIMIEELLGPVAVSVDELVRQSGAAPAAVQMVLLELELAGRLERHAAGRVSLIL